VVTFAEQLATQVERTNSLVCIGLDPDPTRFPEQLRRLPRREAIVAFNRAIVEATADLVCAYKPNLGFYVAQGIDGIAALLATRELIPAEIPVILDCKVGDMGSTAAAYAAGYFGEWGFAALTANPYQGEDSLAPFLAYPDRAVFVLCRTSNPSSADLQDVRLQEGGLPVYVRIATRANQWRRDYPASVGLVVGATRPRELAEVRAACPKLPILLPGVGAQEGDVEESVANGLTADGAGLIVSSSRGIIYAGGGSDFADRARDSAISLRDQINAVRAQRTGTAVAS
jgi:orotidine-5'-phosphate decarboxylase